MKAGTIDAIILGGLGACALAGGIALGQFTANGLARNRPMDEVAQLQAFMQEQEVRRLAQQKRASRTLPPPIRPGANHHICEGCDARRRRNPYYGELAAGGLGEPDLAPDAFARPTD